ncbi:MAG TPA: manganese efflux pump MntP family protein [Anaerolineaceae bacterium]|nr:manganese efflux pump MntP family protein [Anaerolineaceae bacterium]
MGIIEILVIAVGLAMDAFAVSLGIGTTGKARTTRPIFRISFHMGFFQGFMTLIGWFAGSRIAHLIAQFDHWIAFVLLAFVGIRMIQSGLGKAEEVQSNDPSRGGHLMMICIATSIDAMAVGLSLAMVEVNITLACLVIGIVTLGLSLFGLLTGCRLGERFGKRMEILGGLLLVGIGLRIVISHMMGG